MNPDFHAIDIFNLKGVKVFSTDIENPETEKITLNLKHFGKGVYILRITAGENFIFKKIMKL